MAKPFHLLAFLNNKMKYKKESTSWASSLSTQTHLAAATAAFSLSLSPLTHSLCVSPFKLFFDGAAALLCGVHIDDG